MCQVLVPGSPGNNSSLAEVPHGSSSKLNKNAQGLNPTWVGKGTENPTAALAASPTKNPVKP